MILSLFLDLIRTVELLGINSRAVAVSLSSATALPSIGIFLLSLLFLASSLFVLAPSFSLYTFYDVGGALTACEAHTAAVEATLQA